MGKLIHIAECLFMRHYYDMYQFMVLSLRPVTILGDWFRNLVYELFVKLRLKKQGASDIEIERMKIKEKERLYKGYFDDGSGALNIYIGPLITSNNFLLLLIPSVIDPQDNNLLIVLALILWIISCAFMCYFYYRPYYFDHSVSQSGKRVKERNYLHYCRIFGKEAPKGKHFGMFCIFWYIAGFWLVNIAFKLLCPLTFWECHKQTVQTIIYAVGGIIFIIRIIYVIRGDIKRMYGSTSTLA